MIPDFLKTAWADVAALSLTAVTSPLTSLLSLHHPRDADGLLYHWGRGMLRAAVSRAAHTGVPFPPHPSHPPPPSWKPPPSRASPRSTTS